MADRDEAFINALVGLEATMASLRTSVKSSQMGNIIAPYDGDAMTCNQWLTSVEKYTALIDDNSDGRKVQTAYMTAKGAVSDFIKRWVDSRNDANPPIPVTWTSLKTDISSHFSTVADSDYAHDVLKKIRQGANETVSSPPQ